MKIKVSFELEMSPDNLRDWANEYGLDMSEVANDATHHLGELIRETVKGMSHVEEFTFMKNYRVQ
jgi:hypothetical protein